LFHRPPRKLPRRDRVFQNLMTATYKCVDIVELEKVPIKGGDTVQFYTDKVQLAGAYIEILGWLEGYFTAMNMYDSRTAGDITMGTKGREWMVWINQIPGRRCLTRATNCLRYYSIDETVDRTSSGSFHVGRDPPCLIA
jgi:hypothetical protein